MIIYHYAENGEFLHASDALESPLEEGVYLIPRNATPVQPPEAVPGFSRVFDGEAWGQVIDKRGTVFWLSHDDGRVITELGQDIPEGAFSEQPPAPEPPKDPEPTPPAEIPDEGSSDVKELESWRVIIYLDSHNHVEGTASDLDVVQNIIETQLSGALKIIARNFLSSNSEKVKIESAFVQTVMGSGLSMSPEDIQTAFNEAATYVWTL